MVPQETDGTEAVSESRVQNDEVEMKGMLAVLFLAWLCWEPTPDPTVQALADYRLQHAKIRVAQACREIEEETAGKAWCRTPIKIVEWPRALMPPGVRAMTTMDGPRNGKRTCRLTFTQVGMEDNETLAHEACHCALDGDVVGSHGWLVLEDQQKIREERAAACGREKGGRP